MQFKVPQFLDIEDKIFGPFTFSEFVYLVGGAGLCFIIFKLLGFWLGVIPILIVGGSALALTFYRPNDKPLVNMIEAGMKFAMQNKLYIWERRKYKKSVVKASIEKSEVMNENNVKLTGSKLRDLAWSLDVKDLKKDNTDN
jgi:hypothetical protein